MHLSRKSASEEIRFPLASEEEKEGVGIVEI
jgi:hypothetical protein